MTTYDAHESIKLVNYQGPLLDKTEFERALENGPRNIEYTQLISHLSKELKFLYGLDEHVNPITSPEDSVPFIMEVGSFLNELGCCHQSLVQGPTSERLVSKDDRLLLIEYLASELMAGRITRERKPEKGIELKLKESNQAADLRKVLQTLGFPKPPPNITVETLMRKLHGNLEGVIKKHGSDVVGTALFNITLPDRDWQLVSDQQLRLHDEFTIRREMLLTRLDCTIESFQWSNGVKGKEDRFKKAFSDGRNQLSFKPAVSLASLLAARSDLAVIEKTSSASVRKNTRSSVNSVIIGRVPDRGGRAHEQEPPPPEMPPWQQQRAPGPPGGGQRGGFQGGQRGGGFQGQRGGGGGFQGQRGDGGGFQGQRGDSGGYQGGQQRGGGYGNKRGSGGSSGSNFGDNRKDYGNNRNSFGNDRNESFDSAGSYSNTSGNRYDNKPSYSNNQSSYSSNYGNNQSYGSNQSSYGSNQSSYGSNQSANYSYNSQSSSFDSAGSYSNNYSSYQEPKRVKTYDHFQQQQNRTTHADEYVQESQHNSQYHARGSGNGSYGGGGGGSRGRSNYNRGGSSGGGGGYRRGGGGYH